MYMPNFIFLGIFVISFAKRLESLISIDIPAAKHLFYINIYKFSKKMIS